MKINLKKYSYRYAEQILNSRLKIKEEIENVILDSSINLKSLSRPNFNTILKEKFMAKGWESEPSVFEESKDPGARMDFMKERIGIEVGFGHSSFLGIDLLKFQIASYSGLDRIDIGVYVVTTRNFQKNMKTKFDQKWDGSLQYEKLVDYLPHLRSAIQVPVYVIGIDL